MKILECCDEIKTVIKENTFWISSISQKQWLKVIEHDGTIELGSDPKLHNYDITHSPFCGIQIEGQADPFTKPINPEYVESFLVQKTDLSLSC
jgi:hypothetical protein